MLSEKSKEIQKSRMKVAMGARDAEEFVVVKKLL